MVNAARGREAGNAATRIVFDEGHHLFDAADSTFAAALIGQEQIEFRCWTIGAVGKSRGRRRGLLARVMVVAPYDEAGSDESARAGPAAGQPTRGGGGGRA